jgi:hypothetical protein
MENLGFKSSSYFIFLFFSYQPNMGLPLEPKGQNVANAGDVYWFAWEPFTALILYKEEGEGGDCCANIGCSVIIYCICAACTGRSHASALFCDHFSCRRSWACIEFHELFWLAKCWNLAILGRFYYCWRVICPSASNVLSLSLSLSISKCICVCASIAICIYVCMYACMHHSIYLFTCPNTHTNIYIQIIILAFR